MTFLHYIQIATLISVVLLYVSSFLIQRKLVNMQRELIAKLKENILNKESVIDDLSEEISILKAQNMDYEEKIEMLEEAIVNAGISIDVWNGNVEVDHDEASCDQCQQDGPELCNQNLADQYDVIDTGKKY